MQYSDIELTILYEAWLDEHRILDFCADGEPSMVERLTLTPRVELFRAWVAWLHTKNHEPPGRYQHNEVIAEYRRQQAANEARQ